MRFARKTELIKKYYSPDKDGSIKTIVINGIDRNDEPIFKTIYSAKLSAVMILILKKQKGKKARRKRESSLFLL